MNESLESSPTPGSRSRRRKVVWLAACGLVSTLGFGLFSWRPIGARVVTMMAIGDAGERLAQYARLSDWAGFKTDVIDPLAEEYGTLFRLGLLDRIYALDRLPTPATGRDALPVWAVIGAFYKANETRFQSSSSGTFPGAGAPLRAALQMEWETLSREVELWLPFILARPILKEALVDHLAMDDILLHVPADPSGSDNQSQTLLDVLFSFLTDPRGALELAPMAAPWLDRLTERQWQAIQRDCRHAREKVRAGALLLLSFHRSKEIVIAEGRRMLEDPSSWVRLAAAGTLALRGDARGAGELISGLEDERHVVRYWCGLGLSRLQRSRCVKALHDRSVQEPDQWVKERLESFLQAGLSNLEKAVYPHREWRRNAASDLGLDPDALAIFAARVDGRGCVVRYGYMAHSWGDIAKQGDVASAANPVSGYFLLRAVREKYVKSLEEPVVSHEPALDTINTNLGYKDTQITWRQLADQISCYGVTEAPASAFDFSDYNMALLWDTLFLTVYGSTIERVDAEILQMHLEGYLTCQDSPSFLAFGHGDRPGRLTISPRDFARFGLLFLRWGRWDGGTVMPYDYILKAINSPLPGDYLHRTRGESAEMLPGQRSIGGGSNQTDHLGSYSFGWWRNGVDREGKRHWPDAPLDAYAALGRDGMSALVVIPGLDLVASWNDARVKGREMQNEALKLLAAAVREEE